MLSIQVWPSAQAATSPTTVTRKPSVSMYYIGCTWDGTSQVALVHISCCYSSGSLKLKMLALLLLRISALHRHSTALSSCAEQLAC